MSSKPTILINRDLITTYNAVHIEEVSGKYFNIEFIDTNKHYDKKSTVVVSYYEDFKDGEDKVEQHIKSKGIRHIIDHAWDSHDSSLDNASDFTLRPIDYIRFNEAFSFEHWRQGYDKLTLTTDPKYDFLLLMKLCKPHRDKLYNALQSVLQDNIYSYIEKGISLQNANDIKQDTYWERGINPNWYRDTRFSVVSESMIDSDPTDTSINISEKTYKPLAFQHPFVVWGQSGTLQLLHRLGFETFDNIIDESYDLETDSELRFKKVIDNIFSLTNLTYDKITQDKLLYNREHFYNQDIIEKLYVEQVVNPTLEFIES